MSKTVHKLIGSNLPLIFVNGRPKSIHKMTDHEVYKFIKHIIAIRGTSLDTKPIWWPSETISYAKFSNSMPEPNILKSIVYQCYKYYEEICTLCASEQLANHEYHEIDIRKDPPNNTYSIFVKATNELLAMTMCEHLVRNSY